MMLEARCLWISRGEAQVLRGVRLALVPGQVTAICGPNGAGKSSLLAALAGLEDDAGPAVALDGETLSALAAEERARRIGYLPQDGGVAWNLSVAALVRLGRLPWRTSPAEDGAAVAEALAALDLEDLALRQVRSLSGGERARALLARVLAGRSHWILADEPLAALDLSHQLALARRFRALAAGGAGVVLVIHDLALAMNQADRVVVLSNGSVAADGPPGEALDPAVIERVWGVRARWLGEEGARALATG